MCSLFNVLRFPLNQLGQVLSISMQTKVAVTRLHAFLTREKLPSVQAQPLSPLGVGSVGVGSAGSALAGRNEPAVVSMKHACFAWERTDTDKIAINIKGQNGKKNGQQESKQDNDKGNKRVESKEGTFHLTDLTCELLQGRTYAIVGPVGAGKSSFVQVRHCLYITKNSQQSK